MKRGAIWAALAAVVLLAVVCAQRWAVGSCDFEQKIITPDGMEFVFTGPRIVPGSLDMDWPLEGEGLPPVEHLSQEIYGMPGALYKGTIVKPRVLTISSTIHGITTTALMDMKARMQSALRWDRGDPGDPSIYRFTMNGVSRDLYVRYDSAVERRIGRPGRVVVVAIRLIAYDPLWYDPDSDEEVLSTGNELYIRLVMSKLAGEWDDMGPPISVAAGGGGFRDVRWVAVSPDGLHVYFGGIFTDFNAIPAADNIVRWDITTRTWQAVGGGLNGPVGKIAFGPDGTLYVGGAFTDGSGGAGDLLADYVARYDPATDTWVNVGGGPGAGVVTEVDDIVVGTDGTLYIGGLFTNWAATGADHVARYTAGGGWATLTVAQPSTVVRCLSVMPNGEIVVGGEFITIGANPFLRIAEFDPVAGTWATMGAGFNGAVRSLAVAANGTLYAGGQFTVSGAITVNRVASWNGTVWSSLLSGLNNDVIRLFAHPDGSLYVSGSFTNAGDIAGADYIAKWTGYAWAQLDLLLPAPVSAAPRFLFAESGDLYIGTDVYQVNVPLAAHSALTCGGTALSYPVIEVKNACTQVLIRNETTNHEITYDAQILDGEIVIIDLAPGVKSVESNWWGNRLGSVSPDSDLAVFCLESYPRAAYGGVEGSNLLSIFLTGAVPRESGDNNNQLSGWENITGISQHNTDLGRLYVNIVADGGGFYHVDLYMDPAKAAGDLVGHTATYNGAGAKAIVADNASGLGGTITVDAVVGADTDILVWFTILTASWSNRWWDLEAAVS